MISHYLSKCPTKLDFLFITLAGSTKTNTQQHYAYKDFKTDRNKQVSLDPNALKPVSKSRTYVTQTFTRRNPGQLNDQSRILSILNFGSLVKLQAFRGEI